MDTSQKYLRTASEALNIPLDELEDAWSHGKDVHISAKMHIGLSHLYPSSAIFIHSGVVREYFKDNTGREHTLRFVQNPSMIAPPLNNLYCGIESDVLSQTLTSVKGRIWELSFMQNYALTNPLFFRSVIAILCESAYIKQRNDIRLYACSAAERYALFLKEFPEVANMVPLKYIASYLKMTPETMSRVRNNFSKKSKK